jgi:peptide/nickel transport system permease protein
MSNWRKFKKNKLAFTALIILAILYLLVIFADFFAPYNYDQDNPNYCWAPPSKIKLFDLEKGLLRPCLVLHETSFDRYYQRTYQETKQVVPIKFFTRGYEYKILGLWPTNIHLFGVNQGRIHLLGADYKGRDIFSRLLYGGRVSLTIGLIGVAISFVIGMIVGGISGYFGGWVDNCIMRLVEMMMLLPGFYFLLALRSSFPPGMDSREVYILIVVILSFIGWASIARVIRGMVLSIRENEFVLAARANGIGSLRIIFNHILPHTFSYVVVALCLSIPSYIIGEAALSFLGLGIQEPYASWGNMLVATKSIVNIKLYPWIIAPGIAIIITTMCFNIIGERLRDIFDPRRKFI